MNNWKGIGLLLLAAVVAVAAGGIAYLYLTGSASGHGAHVATVPVVVAAEAFETHHADRPWAEPALSLEPRRDNVCWHSVQALELDRATQPDE